MSEFMATYDSDSPEMKKSLDDISKLLTVTSDNYEKLIKEKWFQRAWFTVTGKNKKLMNINKHNLLLVQKGSLLFLQNLGKQNRLLMKSVHFALSRVEKLGIQNLKIKNYLIQLIDKYDETLGGIRDRLDIHDKEISMIKNTNSSLIQIVVGCFLFVIAVIVLVSTNKSPITVGLSIVAGVLGLISLLTGITISYKKRLVVIEDRDINTKSEVQLRNRNVAVEVRNNLSRFLFKASLKEIIFLPVNPFIERYSKLLEFIEEFGNTEKNAESVANFWDNIYQIDPDLGKETMDGISCYVLTYTDMANAILNSIIANYLPDSVGVQLRCEIDDGKQNRLFDDVVGAFKQYLEHFQYLRELKESLVLRYPRYRRFLTEDPFLRGVKDFFKGFLIIPDDTDKFLESYINDSDSYLQGWDSVSENLKSSLFPMLERYSELYAKECSNCFEPLFREFDVQNVELSMLNQDLIEQIDIMNREEESSESS